MDATNLPYVTPAQMRDIDRYAIETMGIPGVVLMENAGRAVYERAAVVLFGRPGRVEILCGKGNNGGDGYVVARHMLDNGQDARVLVAADPNDIRGDARTNLDILRKIGGRIIPVLEEKDVAGAVAELGSCDLIIDGLLGTGTRGEVRGVFRRLIEAINNSGKVVISIDIPSGLCAECGVPLGVAVKATETVTLGLPKTGFENPAAREYTGRLTVADISIPDAAVRSVLSGPADE